MNFFQLVESVKKPKVPRYFLPDKNGDVLCNSNELTSLKGAPQKVEGRFWCYSNQLTSLQGAPQEVGGGFTCSNNQITSLQGAPQHVGGSFYCFKNQLTSLKGAPQYVGGDFECSDNQLTSLEGAPQQVQGDFYCFGNPNLLFLELARMDLGNKVKGNIYFVDNHTPVDKAKCTRAYYDLLKHLDKEHGTSEQEEIGEI